MPHRSVKCVISSSNVHSFSVQSVLDRTRKLGTMEQCVVQWKGWIQRLYNKEMINPESQSPRNKCINDPATYSLSLIYQNHMESMDSSLTN